MPDVAEFAVACGWCRRPVVSFAQPPAMIEVTVNDAAINYKHFDRICSDCFTELIKFELRRSEVA